MSKAALSQWYDESLVRWEEDDTSYDDRFNELEFQVKKYLAVSGPDAGPFIDIMFWAWSLIANAGCGDWEQESEAWRGAALRWRDQFHSLIPIAIPNDVLHGLVREADSDSTLFLQEYQTS
jgi:hypothetical protein